MYQRYIACVNESVFEMCNGRLSKNVQIHVTEFYLLEKALNSKRKWFHQTQHNVMKKRDFTEGIEVLKSFKKNLLEPPPPLS